MTEPIEILLAEDDDTDVLLLRRAFKEAGIAHALQVARDGQDALDFLSRRADSEEDCMPALVILDLKMPRRNGIEVLQWMRSQPGMRTIPAVVFSSSGHPEDVERAYAIGANAFIVKPASTVQRAQVARFIQAWLQFVTPPLPVIEGFKAAKALHVLRGFEPVAP